MTVSEAKEAIIANYPEKSRYSILCEALDMALNLLEKAARYRWHDLRKNPDDLPVKDGTYRCIFKDEENSHFEIDYRKNFGFGKECFLEHCELPECPKEYYFEDLDEDDEVIAWQEIEPFEKEKE